MSYLLAKRILLAVAVLSFLLLGGAAPARAGFAIELSAVVNGQPTTPLDILDNKAGDQSAVKNRISYSADADGTDPASDFAGAFSIDALLTTTDSPGLPNVAQMKISTFTITNDTNSFQTINISITSTGFSAPGGAGAHMLVSSSIGGTFTFANAGDTDGYHYQVTADQSVSGGAQFGQGITLVPSFSSYTATAAEPDDTASFSMNESGLFQRSVPDNGYSLSSFSTIGLAAGSQVQFSGTITAVDPPAAPAPAALVLLLTGLPPLGLAGWRRYRRQTTA